MGNRRIDETDEEFVGISDAIKYIKKTRTRTLVFCVYYTDRLIERGAVK